MYNCRAIKFNHIILIQKAEGNTQAISVVLLLREDSGDLSATSARGCLHRPPWRFHHRLELVRTTNATCIAKQEFFDLGSRLPLWCVEPIHCGNEVFRFNLVVRNFSAMVDFYTRLTQNKKPSCSKPGFCLFTLYSQPGLDIQLALKRSEYLTPYPTSKAMLKFATESVAKMADLKPYKIGDDFMVKDPDGNPVLLEIKEQNETTQALKAEETTNWYDRKEGRKEEFTDDASSLLDDLQSEISVSESLDSGAYCASWEGSDSSTSGYFELSELSSLSLDDIDEDSVFGDCCRPESDIRDDESVVSAFF
ncbi:FAM124A [Branchiostoma lanceolatum]|uniref:FAM124A protein n=1 Tax=Branchiostoma lanceolatum TaxID=7740 RepID=A0A8K0E5C8_BRALA|nr:FAM124A [Branchiostoma lanceolatum]